VLAALAEQGAVATLTVATVVRVQPELLAQEVVEVAQAARPRMALMVPMARRTLVALVALVAQRTEARAGPATEELEIPARFGLRIPVVLVPGREAEVVVAAFKLVVPEDCTGLVEAVAVLKLARSSVAQASKVLSSSRIRH